MPKENNRNTSALIARIEQAQELLNEALVLARKGAGKAAFAKQDHFPKDKSPAKELDFSMPIRAFVKKQGAGMSGPKKFALLLAYLAKGDLKKTIPSVEIKKHWNKMTAKSLLGMEFNTFYSASAKENDWVNAEKNGSYNLRPSWKAIFDE
jgi:hypothetical protein